MLSEVCFLHRFSYKTELQKLSILQGKIDYILFLASYPCVPEVKFPYWIRYNSSESILKERRSFRDATPLDVGIFICHHDLINQHDIANLLTLNYITLQ